jgi:hypothetical protein
VNLALWIVAGALAAVFSFAGANKVFVPREKLAAAPGGGWVMDFGPGALGTIGTLEILAAVGLILPAALDIAVVLVPLAAVGLALVMIGAIVMRLRRHERKSVLVDVVYLGLAVFVAWGRFAGLG